MTKEKNLRNLSTFATSYQRNSRSVFALLLIALSILSALFIVHQANRSNLVWAARAELPVGEVISQSSLRPIHVRLIDNGKNYIAAEKPILGFTVTKAISAGDLIPVRSISRSEGATHLRSVPLQVATNDLPMDLVAGERVDIYALPLQSGSSQTVFQISEVAASQVVESIDSKARALGGAIGVLLRIDDDEVITLFAQTARSRIVLVRSAS